ncbi:site-2 protease family protein [soil metagenome]
MLNGSLPLGRLAGATMRMHWSAIVVALLIGLSLSDDLGVAGAAIAVVGFFISILAHELAHVYVARHYGVGTTTVDLWALGGVARLEHDPRTPRAEGWIAVAGPLASVVAGVVFFGAALLLNAADVPGSIVNALAWVALTNGILAVFNLLPGAPLDGGRVVRALRWWRHGNRYKAMREAGQAGRVIGWGLVAFGFSLTFNGYPGLFLAITGFFIAVNARAEVSMADVGERLDGLKVRDVTWFGVAETGTDMDADSMIWQRSRLGGAGAVAVRNADGELGGLVLEDQLWAVPAEQRPWVMLTSLMAPFNRLAQADPDDELASVLPKLNPLRPVVTVWREGRLLGVVPPKALQARLQPLGAVPA